MNASQVPCFHLLILSASNPIQFQSFWVPPSSGIERDHAVSIGVIFHESNVIALYCRTLSKCLPYALSRLIHACRMN